MKRDQATVGIWQNATIVGALALGEGGSQGGSGNSHHCRGGGGGGGGHLAQVVSQDATIAAVQGSTTGEVLAAALRAEPVTAGTAQEAVRKEPLAP